MTARQVVTYTCVFIFCVSILLLLEVALGLYLYKAVKDDFEVVFVKELRQGLCKEEVKEFLSDSNYMQQYIDERVKMLLCQIGLCNRFQSTRERRHTDEGHGSWGHNHHGHHGFHHHRGEPGQPGPPGTPGHPGTQGQKGEIGGWGSPGAKGDQGLQGNSGQKGDIGHQGINGAKGERGMTGDRGIQGEKGASGGGGSPGAKGDQGLQGNPGQKGDIGPRGLNGDKGERGMTGDRGTEGQKGEKGDSGQTSDIGARGLKGDKGERGMRGDDGQPGKEGPPGKDGEDGKPGLKCDCGTVGLPGERGEKGEMGAPGKDGHNGIPGIPGFPGPVGPPGVDGKIGPKGAKGHKGKQGLPSSKGYKLKGDCGSNSCQNVVNVHEENPKIDPRFAGTSEIVVNGHEENPKIDPMFADCEELSIGKIDTLQSVNADYTTFMVDSNPPTQREATKFWATLKDIPKLFEFNDVISLTRNKPSVIYELEVPFQGNAHVVYKGFFFYSAKDNTSDIIKYDLTTKKMQQTLSVPNVSSKLKHLYLADYNNFDFSVDQNGLWVIFSSAESDYTSIIKINSDDMTIENTRDINIVNSDFIDMFIASGKLYTLHLTPSFNIEINLAIDMFSGTVEEVHIPGIHRTSKITMATYDHRWEKLFLVDGEKMVLYLYSFSCEDLSSSPAKVSAV